MPPGLLPMFLALDELDRGLAPEDGAVVDDHFAGAIAAVGRIR